jgi:hypothetical protein
VVEGCADCYQAQQTDERLYAQSGLQWIQCTLLELRAVHSTVIIIVLLNKGSTAMVDDCGSTITAEALCALVRIFNKLKKSLTSGSTSLSPGASFLAASACCEHRTHRNKQCHSSSSNNNRPHSVSSDTVAPWLEQHQ